MNNHEEEVVGKELRITRVIPDEIQARFANDLVIQHQPEYFVLTFFEMHPPMIIAETAEEVKEAYKEIEDIEAKSVARIIVTPKMLKTFIDTMTKNAQKYERRYGVTLDDLETEEDGESN